MSGVTDQMRQAESGQDRTLQGIGIVVLSWLMLACMDAGSKILASSYPVVQILWIRYLLLIVVACWLLRREGKRMRSNRPWLQLSRGLLLVIEIDLVIYAFSKMELADVHAILAITPLMVTALSVRCWAKRSASGVGARSASLSSPC